MTLSSADVNLVVALDALLRERSVTGAAKRMGLSQPAMSHTLTRLRDRLGDPLLVRAGRQMTLTERAEGMIGQVTALMSNLESLFGHMPAPFEATGSARTFQVAACEYAQFVVLPPLHALLSAQAPLTSLKVLPLGAVQVASALRCGEIDIALGAFQPNDAPTDVHTAELTQDRLVGLARIRNLKARGRAELDAYLAASHLVVASRGARGDAVDELLARRGLSRHVAMTVPSLLAAPYIVATSELLMTLPERVAQAFLSALPLRRFEPPFDMPTPSTLMMWHERTNTEPAHHWLRQLIIDSARHPSIAAGRRKRA
jgi:DNA-binding transcriptional LysR family regulator